MAGTARVILDESDKKELQGNIDQKAGVRELTRAEFDALSAEEKNAKTMYIITDDDDFVSITEPPTGIGTYPIVIEEEFTIGEVTFPKWAKGMYISGSGDATMHVIDTNGTMYIAYRNNDSWGSANIVAKTTQLAYNLAKAKGYTGTEAEFGAKLAELLALEIWDGEYVTLITFTIEGTEYQAEEGMTWAEWVKSEDNTGGYLIGAVGDTVLDQAGFAVNGVTSSSVIQDGVSYSIFAVIEG